MAKNFFVHAVCNEFNSDGWNGKGKAGDQTGKELRMQPFYVSGDGWQFVLRHPDKKLGEKAVEVAKKICESNLVGYSQPNRKTLYDSLKKHNWDVDAYLKSGELTECDCSSFAWSVWCCLIEDMRKRTSIPATIDMCVVWSKYGFEIIKDTDTINGKNNFLGDVFVRAGHHTAICILKTSKEENTKIERDLKRGCTGNDVKLLQDKLTSLGYDTLGIDGIFGKNTEKAVIEWKKENMTDGIFDKKCIDKMFSR